MEGSFQRLILVSLRLGRKKGLIIQLSPVAVGDLDALTSGGLSTYRVSLWTQPDGLMQVLWLAVHIVIVIHNFSMIGWNRRQECTLTGWKSGQ